MRALISVSDKTGIVEFAKKLEELGVEIISTGGTFNALKEEGINVQSVSDVTGFPECLDGRVKTLHPNVHGGILARRDMETHMQQIKDLKITPIDIVAINLYPFKETIKKTGTTMEDAIENIDIGGPAMLRSSAKNHKDVTVVCEPTDYDVVIDQIKAKGHVDDELKYKLALKVFRHTSAYDCMIAQYLADQIEPEFPDSITMTYEKIQDLRYGENSHQNAALYKEVIPYKGALVNAVQLHGKELSYNNINDANGAIETLKEFDEPTVVAVKHANPCGVGTDEKLVCAYKKAHDCDPISIFGGIVAANKEVDIDTAIEINKIFVEILIAPSFSEEAMKMLKKKENIRILQLEDIMGKPKGKRLDLKKVSGGILIQDADDSLIDNDKLKCVTLANVVDSQMKDLELALKVVKHTKSNGIVFAKNGMTIAIAPGQTNRIWAVENCIKQANFELEGCVMASDAFFPFSDCVETAAKAGIKAIIQPGGSIRDQESIDKANELGVAMVFSGLRHFYH